MDLYDPFSQGGQAYLGSVDVEVGFAGRKTTETPYDQDDLAQSFVRVSMMIRYITNNYFTIYTN